MSPEAQATLLGQSQFGGGMNAFDPGPTEYPYGLNVAIRDGKPTTRPGIRRRWASTVSGYDEGFWFNEDNAKYNDATHTKFWFAWNWVKSVWGDMQGVGLYRFPSETDESIILATEGVVYKYKDGYTERITVTPAIASTETVTFEQAEDYLYMFRGEDDQPMRWDGTATGFVVVPDGAGDNIPYAGEGSYHTAGRMWAFRDRDDVYASDILDPTEYDVSGQLFGIRSGDGDQLMKLWPFHEDTYICFKRKSVTGLTGINSIVESGAVLADYVRAVVIDTQNGLVASRAVVNSGEDVWWLSYAGIQSLRRNQQNKFDLDPVAVSAPIQPLIDRINWDSVGVAAAATHENYIIFAVPIDESTVNNAMLVYDKLAPAGEGQRGAWLGLWQSKGKVMSVIGFFHLNQDLCYLDSLGFVHQMFVNIPRDSNEPIPDTPAYAAATANRIGDYVVSGGAIYECNTPNTGVEPPDTDYWTLVTDPEHAYDIESVVETRQYRLDPSWPAVRLGRGELLYRHRDPKMTVELLNDEFGSSETLVSDQEYSQTEYDIADTADWDPETDADGWKTEHRKDYAVKLSSTTYKMRAAGFTLGVWRTHSHRFIKQLVGDRSFGFRITNTQGQLKLVSVSVPVTGRRRATKLVA